MPIVVGIELAYSFDLVYEGVAIRRYFSLQTRNLATGNPKLIKGRHKVCPYIIQQK